VNAKERIEDVAKVQEISCTEQERYEKSSSYVLLAQGSFTYFPTNYESLHFEIHCVVES